MVGTWMHGAPGFPLSSNLSCLAEAALIITTMSFALFCCSRGCHALVFRVAVDSGNIRPGVSGRGSGVHHVV